MRFRLLVLLAAVLPILSAPAFNVRLAGKKLGFSDILPDGSLLVTGCPENRYNNWLAHILPMEITPGDRQLLGNVDGASLPPMATEVPAPAGKLLRISGEAKLHLKSGQVKVCLRQIGADNRTLEKDSFVGITLHGIGSGWEPFETIVQCSPDARKLQFCVIGINMSRESTAQLRALRWEGAEAAVSVRPFELLPRAVVYQHPVSRSQWLWNADVPPADNGKSYFRLKFTLPEPVAGASFRVKYDDKGSLFVNGRPCDPAQFAQALKQGENVLAAALVNGRGGTGILFYGEIKLASGKMVTIHSDTAVKAAAVAPSGWTAPGFDDSKWHAAKSQGDVLAYPWARWYDYAPEFTSPTEKTQLAAVTAAAVKLPAGLEAEPMAQTKIVYQGIQPKLSVNGKIYEPLFNLSPSNSKYCNSYWDNAVLKTAKLGFKIYQLTVEDHLFYKAPGKYDFSALDQQARRLLNLEPDALLLVHIAYSRMEKWCQVNPDERMEYAAGAVEPNCYDERVGRPLRPSAASEKFRDEVKTGIRSFAGYVKSQPWGKRVVAVRVSYGIYTEWHAYGMYQGPDTGKAMTAAFRKYLTAKYGTDAALQQAWGHNGSTLETAAVPGMTERTRPEGFFLDPKTDRKVLDYYDCLANVMADLMLFMGKTVKEELPGCLCGAYYGYVFSSHPPEGANVLLDKVLSSPYIDFLSNPPPYTAFSRQAGGDYMQRTVPATFRRYGKLDIIEDDSRFHHLKKYTEPFVTRDALETRMTMRRNICNTVFDGSGIQLADPLPGAGARPNAFDDADVLEAMQESFAAIGKLGTLPPESGNDTAVVVNYPERLRRDGNPGGSALISSLYVDSLPRLNRAGISYDLLTLADFLAAKQRYRTVLFLNAFSLSAAERQAVKAKIRCRGTTAVWLVAPGCVTEAGISDAAMTDLTGIELTGAGTVPAVRSVDRKAVTLKSGAVRKSLADGSTALFLAAPPASGAQWQELLKEAGAHIFTAPGSLFRRHGQAFMLHTGTAGHHIIRLPAALHGKKAVELFSGKEYSASEIKLYSRGPATWLFKIKE